MIDVVQQVMLALPEHAWTPGQRPRCRLHQTRAPGRPNLKHQPTYPPGQLHNHDQLLAERLELVPDDCGCDEAETGAVEENPRSVDPVPAPTQPPPALGISMFFIPSEDGRR